MVPDFAATIEAAVRHLGAYETHQRNCWSARKPDKEIAKIGAMKRKYS
jgi:hypothetical protein